MRRSVTLLGVLALGAMLLSAMTLATIGVANAEGKIRLAQTSTVTNCMMTCNSQAATCQTACLVPGTRADRGRDHHQQRQCEHELSGQLHDPADFLPHDLCAELAVAVSLC